MKRPRSPTQLLQKSSGGGHGGGVCLPFNLCGELLQEPEEGHPDGPQQKKRLLYSLCEVCNLQLNSAAQAQVHYNGRSHLRRVKQLNNGELPPSTGSGTNPAPAGTLTCSSTGSAFHSSCLPALVRTPPVMMQSTLDMKSFMSFPVDTTSAVGLFPNFNTMDPVQKAVINHTFGVSIAPKRKQVISCNICQLRFNSDSQADAHYKGSKHAKKLKVQETPKHKTLKNNSTPSQDRGKRFMSSTTSSSSSSIAVTACSSEQPVKIGLHPNNLYPMASSKSFFPAAGLALAPSSILCKPLCEPTPASPAPEMSKPTLTKPTPVPAVPAVPAAPAPCKHSDESEEEKAKKLLYCSLCKVAVNSLSQLDAHNTGSKHKTMLEARDGAGPIKAYPRPGAKLKVQATITKGSGLQNKMFHCEICDVHVNSEIQLKQHISSRRHKDRVAGKPLKPKYSPYSKQQHSTATLEAKLAFQKDLLKPLSQAFLSRPFIPTTIPSISLHPRPNTSIFQKAALPTSFLRAAPGPIRPTGGSILFAPY
ncbi:zinc finger protein 385B isoform X1 [Oncorhynchus mykiss]|uniref:zinc finger protein 385B isoform X1 n=1 Tax=Oncorhynchus mykiss TaxID=8022 RepID=UPI0018777F78|nr:zinc finger protein 385B isoform X1 [Oncorhynchus mykiss]